MFYCPLIYSVKRQNCQISRFSLRSFDMNKIAALRFSSLASYQGPPLEAVSRLPSIPTVSAGSQPAHPKNHSVWEHLHQRHHYLNQLFSQPMHPVGVMTPSLASPQLPSQLLHQQTATLPLSGIAIKQLETMPILTYQLISILKRRRKKMNKHKAHKHRKKYEDSSRYNKEKKKLKRGIVRQKKE